MDPEYYKIKYQLNLNAEYVPKLSETFVIKYLPEDDQLEKKGFRFLIDTKSHKPDPDPVKEQQKKDEIFKDEVKRIKVLRKTEKNRKALASGRYENVDFNNLNLVQRLAIFCECGDHDDGLKFCPHLKNMKSVIYQSTDESSGGEEDVEEIKPEMAGKDKP